MGQAADNGKCGNSFSPDGLRGLKADYLISNPPFGVDRSKAEKTVRDELETRGHVGRFGLGLPRKNDGSPLFTGGANSGESNIRRWIIENDWLEAIGALPDQMFYNTGISTLHLAGHQPQGPGAPG